MATATQPTASKGTERRGVAPLRAGQGHSFFWRKLHSLTGIIPIGAFLIEHIVSNSKRSKAPPPTPRRSSSSTACLSSASSSGASSSSRSPTTRSTASTSPSAARAMSCITPGPATGCT